MTSSDAPYFDAVYKLQEYAGKPRRKRSTGKATWPGHALICINTGIAVGSYVRQIGS